MFDVHDPLPSDVRLLLAASWQRHEPDDDDEPWWTLARDPTRHRTQMAARLQLRAMGWQLCGGTAGGYWWHCRHGAALSEDMAYRQALAELISNAPGSHGDAASPPAPGDDPPGEPGLAEGDSAAYDAARRWCELPENERSAMCAWLRQWDDEHIEPPVFALAAPTLEAVPALVAANWRRRASEHNARQDVIAAALALVDASVTDGTTEDRQLRDAVASYRGQ